MSEDLRSKEEITKKLEEFDHSLQEYSGGDEYTAYRDGAKMALEWVLKKNAKLSIDEVGWG